VPLTRTTALAALLASVAPLTAQQPPFKLAPAVAVEAEDFTVEKGWKVIPDGGGNYMVDIIGFNHISGERLLGIDEKDETASAFLDVTLPEAGKYRLWARYEYPAFCECRFRVRVEQGGKVVVDKVMGAKDGLRYAFGDPKPKAQHDPPWGPEGLMEEAVTTPDLAAGKARIYLKAEKQPQVPGVAAGRHVDCLYLTRDLDDAWMKHYAKQTNLYPFLDAFRDSRGARWEARFLNRSDKAADCGVAHVYNRLPWGVNEGVVVKGLAPGAASAWVPLKLQDTCHFGMTRFTAPGAFEVEVRPVGGAVEKKLSGSGEAHVYLPPYPGKGDRSVTPEEEIDKILAALAKEKPIGKKPTLPLCYGGWMPLGQDNEYGRKYAQLYAALGFRSLHPAHSGPAWQKNLAAAGVPLSKSWAVMGYRNPPTTQNIEAAKRNLARDGLADRLLFFDYGDEIGFGEWMGLVVQSEVEKAKAAGRVETPQQVVGRLWAEWLRANRPAAKPADYWLETWGPVNAALLQPDSNAAAAAANLRLYVDSLLFYEETAIKHVAEGAKAVRAALGDNVLCGANYSCHPFYYPTAAPYIKWFRGGAADLGRHSEYFWQVAQAGPMVNGYVAEHFRCGLRDNPRGTLRQYTMPHAPGNTDASFLRSAFSHLAHGATMLDFFGVGLNESFTENHIDHRAVSRFVALRDVTHAVGFVEDVLPQAKAVPTGVALLVSDSTERWDFAGIATDQAGHDHFGPNFRKTRLHHHIERLGLWTALTFLGSSPDLLIEDDLNDKRLAEYRMLVVVGDCLPPALERPVRRWVEGGGTLLVTAGAGRFDAYKQPVEEWRNLFGLEKRATEDRETFFRPRQELPFLKPLDGVKGDGWRMPALALRERVTPAAGAAVLAKFDDGSAAVVSSKAGKGQVIYVAALPGAAYLWSALQPPLVPDRGPHTHSVPTAFDLGAKALLEAALKTAGVEPLVRSDQPLLDRRLLKTSSGYLLPVANYHEQVGQRVTLTLPGDLPVREGGVSSAVHGNLVVRKGKDGLEVVIPALGYGDVLRLER
jgi:hypothetical protein